MAMIVNLGDEFQSLVNIKGLVMVNIGYCYNFMVVAKIMVNMISSPII